MCNRKTAWLEQADIFELTLYLGPGAKRERKEKTCTSGASVNWGNFDHATVGF